MMTIMMMKVMVTMMMMMMMMTMMMMAEFILLGKRAVKRSRRPRSHGSRSRRLKSAASASHAVGQNLRSLLQAAAAG